jgi:NADH-quinone oxidoreductase subunit J
MDLILFLIFGAIALGCGLSVILQRHPVSSALSLVGVMISLAILYLLLGAEFIAAAQVVVYAGAIMVLFIFVIMLLNAGAERQLSRATLASWFGKVAIVGLGGLLTFIVSRHIGFAEAVQLGQLAGGSTKGNVGDVGNALFSKYLLPFEVTSLLILIALLGAVVLAKKEIDE